MHNSEQEYLESVVQQIDDLVGPETPPDKPDAIYALEQLFPIAHITTELFTFRSLFPAHQYNLIVLVSGSKLRDRRTNQAIFKSYTSGLRVILVDDLFASTLSLLCIGLVENGARKYLFVTAKIMTRLAMTEVMAKDAAINLSLTASEQAEGLRLKKRLGVDIQAPIVALQIPQQDAAATTLKAYLPLLDHLLASGYVVFPLGRQYPQARQHPNLIDARCQRAYDPFMSFFFITASDLFIGTFSGQQLLAMAYQRPALIVNSPICSFSIHAQRDLLMPKKYHSSRLNRALCYEEIISTGLPECPAQKFAEFGVTLLENNPAELIGGFEELGARIAGTYQINTALAQRIKQINQIAHLIREEHLLSTPTSVAADLIDFYAPTLSQSSLSHEYIKMNPNFVRY